MKNLKKMLALVIAAVMIVGTMGMTAMADATGGDQTADSSVSIGGLESGDTVKLYQVIKWVDGSGWALTDDFKDDTDCQAVLAKINASKPSDDPYPVALTEEDVNAFTAVARPLTNAGEATTSTTYSKDVDPGMYLALIVPVNPAVVYNPIIVSADWNTDNETESMIASSENLVGDSAIAKKETLTVEKEVDDNTLDVGKDYHFTIKTTVPAYSDVYQDPFFKVHDTMDEHLDLVVSSIEVYKFDGGTKGAQITTGWSDGGAADGDNSFTLDFTDYVATIGAAQPIVIYYTATLNCPADELTNVTQLDNDAYVEFSNNPTDEDGKTVIKDDTRQYTFTIDGSLLGGNGYKTGEIVKVGVDKDGNWIEEKVELSNTTWHSALSGAEFGVYTSEATAAAESATKATWDADGNKTADGLYTNTVFTTGKITTGSDGLMTIPGLDEGTYYIKELKAPNGYIRDTKVYAFTITPIWGDDETVTEYFDPSTETWSTTAGTGKIASTYTMKTLKGYTVTVDGKQMASYTWENPGVEIPEITTINESSFEVKNTQGVELPSTGGMGTTIFYIIGAVLVLGAGILLVTRRRMSAN